MHSPIVHPVLKIVARAAGHFFLPAIFNIRKRRKKTLKSKSFQERDIYFKITTRVIEGVCIDIFELFALGNKGTTEIVIPVRPRGRGAGASGACELV